MKFTRAAASAAAALVALAVPVPAAAAPGSPGPVGADGADLIAISAEQGRLSLRFRSADQAEGAAGREPGTVRLGPVHGLSGRVPDDPAFKFLGRPGTPVWSVSAGGLRFPAIDTSGVRRGTVRGDSVTLELTSVKGPGAFAAYRLSRWGRPSVLLDSDGQKSTRLPTGRRLGGLAWTFDAPGEYRLTFRATASAGTRTLRDEATYLVEVPAIKLATIPAAPPAPAVVPPPSADNDGTRRKAAATNAQAPAAAPNRAAPASGQRKVISDGHVDMGPMLDGGTWIIRIKDDSTSPPTWRDLSDVVLKATDKAKIAVPSGAGYAFLGRAGDTVWMLPQSQQDGIVWPGWNTQHESVIKGTKGNVTWRFKGVTGPGQFKLFLTGSFGTPQVLFDSAKSLPQQISIPPNTHAHGNWAFTKAGLYKIAVEMTGTTTAGKSVTDTRTLAIAVGDSTDAQAGFGSGGGSGSGDGQARSGALAKTGANIIAVAAAGVLLLIAGAGVLIVTRRRATPSR